MTRPHRAEEFARAALSAMEAASEVEYVNGPGELDALPVGTVIRERDTGPFLGIETIPGVFEKFPNGIGWHVVAGHGDRTSEIAYPATVLWRPVEQEAER